ncbi:bifunctional glycosyltransferase/CDP-glycerol:glycerophosphate glycerophosphotransferase [Actinocorallia populi]|uniref:bifunctional glycosyltransferase/CDP-glycerol:glycerophosphate glycerophosphotransferase n=1 Tax=Actinocorallia populi TaxID=2079200 RepID=UPI0018E55DE0|nr:CDP-glycerol glycerophosphotransferase family protein [Actinocorallia populi]
MHLRSGSPSPLLSVIVPFHDLAGYLPDCLASLAGQTYPELEVVMVDDGSADDGAVAAKAMAERDPRFRLVQQENAGPGPARNTGVAHATGRYLAFADGDDVVPPDAYRLLVRSLERTGSDFAAGNVLRMSEGRTWQSSLHRDIFTEHRERTRAGDHPLLVRDRTPWNKVYRRSFWDEHGFTFPTGLYEDPPVVLTAHAVARAVDVLNRTVYHWRRRPGSITEERHDPANLLQRLRSAECVRHELGVRAPGLVPAYDRHVLLEIELRVFFSALTVEPGPPEAGADAAALAEATELAVRLAGELGPEAAGWMTAYQRLRLHLLRQERLADLRELLLAQKAGGHRTVPVVRDGRHWHARYPFADSVPHGLCDVTRELEAVARIDRAAWVDDTLELEGHAYIRHLEAEESRIRLWLRPVDRFGRIRVPLERVDRPDVTADSGQDLLCYDRSGFRARVPASSLRVLGRLRPSDWRLQVEVTNQGVRLRSTPAAPRSTVQKWPTAVRLERMNAVLRVEAGEDGGEYVLRVRPQEATLVAHRLEGERLILEGTLTRTPLGPLQLVLARKDARVRLAAEVNGLRFRVEVPVAGRAAGGLSAGAWEVRLGGFRVQSDCPDGTHPVPGGELAVSRTRHGVLRLLVRRPRPVVRQVAWAGDGRLELTGSYRGEDRPPELVLRHRRTGEEHRVPLEWRDGDFTAVLRPQRMPRPFGETALGGGRWTLHLGGAAVLVARDVLRALPGPRVCGTHEYAPEVYRMDALELRAKAGPHGDERGRYARGVLLRTVYRERRAQPVRDLALFDSYRGRECSGDPRALFEELRSRSLGVECVWVSADGSFPAPEGARLVQAGGREHLEALAGARYVFGNFVQEPWYSRTPGQTYVQGWYGAPFGTPGGGVLEAALRREAGPSWREHDVAQWDLLLAQSACFEPGLREALGYRGEILTTGRPRTDPLHRPEAPEAAARLRRALDVPQDARVVLYVPGSPSGARGRAALQPVLDLDRVAAALGGDHVLLSRAPHPFGDRPRSASARDVSAWPDLTELCLAADVLVTGHFPALVDFAGTGRPAVLLSADPEAPAPGPVAADTEELIEALTRPQPPGDRHRAFVERYCPHDDGRAAARVLDHLDLR